MPSESSLVTTLEIDGTRNPPEGANHDSFGDSVMKVGFSVPSVPSTDMNGKEIPVISSPYSLLRQSIGPFNLKDPDMEAVTDDKVFQTISICFRTSSSSPNSDLFGVSEIGSWSPNVDATPRASLQNSDAPVDYMNPRHSPATTLVCPFKYSVTSMSDIDNGDVPDFSLPPPRFQFHPSMLNSFCQVTSDFEEEPFRHENV